MLLPFIFLYALAAHAMAACTDSLAVEPAAPPAQQQSFTLTADPVYQLVGKLDALATTVNHIDISVQLLQERAHLWAVLRHHIDAWNDQIKAQEAKMQLLQRSSFDQSDKLTELEALLQRMLQKMITSEALTPPRPSSIGDHAISSRLTSIERQLQNIQNAQQQPHGDCKSQLSSSYTPANQLPAAKEFKQLQALAKRNGKMLERLLQMVSESEADGNCLNAVGDLQQRIDGIAGELATFTGSADVLLKRIEAAIKVTPPHVTDQANGSDSDEQNVDTAVDDEVTAVTQDLERVFEEALGEEDDEVEYAHSEAENEIEKASTPLNGCHDLLARQRAEGVHRFGAAQLNAAGRDYKQRYCAFVQINESEAENAATTASGGWTVILKRDPAQSQENFNRSWAEYRDGFGDLNAEFWWGNEHVHTLSDDSDEPYELRVEVEDFAGVAGWAEWRSFRLAGEEDNYMLILDGFSGNLTNALQYHNEQEFSTYDRRNDHSVDACCPCAITYGSGWWFDNCFQVNLNGVNQGVPPPLPATQYRAMLWDETPLKRARMMVRRLTQAEDP